MKYKIEIIDDESKNCFMSHIYRFEKIKWWGKLGWKLYGSHYLGRNYMCPEIHKGLITVEDMFKRNCNRDIEFYNIKEIHRISISI